MIKHKESSVYENGLMFADNSIFEIFTYNFISGDPENALSETHSIVLTEELTRKYFGEEDPIGKELILENDESYKVTGVIEDLPDNSGMQFTGLISMETYLNNNVMEDMYSPRVLGSGMSFQLYFQFSENFTIDQFNKKFQTFYDREMAEFDNINYVAVVEPIDEIYLNSAIDPGFSDRNKSFLFGFASLGLFIMLLACINYINIATSRAGIRAKEIGMKKILGANKKQLIIQFLGESLILAFIALILGIVLSEFILELTPFNQLINKHLQVDILHNMTLLFGSISVAIIVGLVSGMFPALFLSHTAPLSSMKGETKRSKTGVSLRNVLIALQFVISITAVILTLFMWQQIEYMQNFDVGFEKENVLIISTQNDQVLEKFGNFKEMIIDHHNIVSASFSNSSPGSGLSGYAFDWETESGAMEMYATTQLNTDKHYLETMGIPLVAGEYFSKDRNPKDTTIDFVVNEAMVERLGWKEPIGKKNQFGQVIGVIKDFNFDSARDDVSPMYIFQTQRT